ncbi:MAG TPA: phosphate ABC transporter permease subunit PstC [Acidobacteriota bacterium]|nr:phosphate ABC transporter permease subunit PstC [Acidobacteriota bacterium]
MASETQITAQPLNRALTETKPVGARQRVANFGDRIFYLVARLLALFVILLAVLLVLDLIRGAWESIGHFGLKFLVGTSWDPVARQFSALPVIIGTLVKAFLALLLGVPISFGSAIFICFYTPRWLRPVITYPIELLAGIPSIIFGMWGLFAMVPVIRAIQIWLKAHFGWFFLFNGPAVYGVGVLAGSIILMIMITPIITSIAKEILLTVPRAQIEGMLALGSTKWEAIWKVALPYSRVGLFGAVILGLGRAIGETMAVTMVGGNSFAMIHSLFDPVHSMASLIASEFTEATYSLYVSSLIYIGLVLFGITILISLLAQWLIWRMSKGKLAMLD